MIMITRLAIILLLCAPAWGYDSSYSHYLTLTFDNTKIAADETDWVVTLDLDDLDAAHAFWSTCQTDGDDLRFTDSTGETEFPRHLVTIDTTNKTGEVNFKFSGTFTSASDPTARLYYGNASAAAPAEDSTYGKEAVWSDYTAVYHLGESSGSAVDGTSNDHDGTFLGDLPDSVSGQVGNAQDFDGTTDAVQISDSSNLTFADGGGDQAVTFMAWINPTDATTFRIFSKYYTPGGSNCEYFITLSGTDKFFTKFYHSNPATNIGRQSTATFTGDEGTWVHVAVTYDGNGASSGITQYRNATSLATTDSSAGTYANMTDGTQPLLIGAFGTASYATGKIDDARVIREELDNDWLTTYYNMTNASNSFVTYGTHTANSAPAFTPRVIIFD